MVKFRKHIITYGDTVQSIAQKQLGDMSRWTELVEFNDLRYPYIVDTLEKKLANPEHLKTIGDTLLVRVADDQQSQLISSLRRMNEFDQEEIYALALGKDLDITPLPRDITSPGYDSEVLELKGDSRGRVATVRGVENLKQALLIRIITPLGSYIGHPNYGSKVHEYIGRKNIEEVAVLLNNEIERTIRTDGRITAVELIDYRISGNTYSVYYKVSSISLDDAFDFVVSARNDTGIVTLNDNFNY